MFRKFLKSTSSSPEPEDEGGSGPAEEGNSYFKDLGDMTKFTGWGKKDEPEMEITDITEVPIDWEIGQESILDDECYRITFEITRAENVIAMDSNGLSDPFVEIDFGKGVTLKTKTINKNCNPIWNETFTMYIDDRSTLANMNVFDYDFLGSNDRIGYLDLDLASIPPFHRLTQTLNLSSSVEGEENVGTLTFSYLVEIVKIENATDIKSIGTKGQEKLLGIIQVTVIEGMDLPPMNSDGTCDPFVRLNLGEQSHETKVINGTLNPKWRESFEFRYLSTSGNILQASLWDNVIGLSNNIIGDTEIDLTTITPNKPFKFVIGFDHTSTKISLQLKRLMFAELGATELQLQKEINDAETRVLEQQFSLASTGKDMNSVGYLIVKLIRATNLPNKTMGTMDPFVVIEIENCRSVSPIRENCVEPEWNLTYRFPINDYHSILYFSLWDDEDLVSNVLLGRIAIPLFNCKGLKRYILKDQKLTGIGKGELVVETSVFYNPIRAAVRTFSPKEEIIMKESPNFDISLLQRDVKRITAQVEILQDGAEAIDQIIRWRSKPTSVVAMFMFVAIVYYVEIWMVPIGIGTLLVWNWIILKSGLKHGENWIKSHAALAYFERGRQQEEGVKTSGFGAKLDKMKAIFTTAEGIQKGLDGVASIGEKISHIGQWKCVFITALVTVIMCIASLALYYISARFIIIAWGLNKFRKFYFKPNLVDNNEVADLLSRVPSFIEIQQYRQIRQKRSVAEQTQNKEAEKKKAKNS